MAEEPQTPPSLEEFRAAQAAQAKKVSPPSLDEFRAAQAAQNGQQPPFAQAPSQQQPPQGGSVGAPAGASRSTSAVGGGGAIAAPPAPAMSLSDIDRARAAQLPDEQPTLPPGGAQLAREGIIRKEGQVVSPEEKIAAAPTPTLYPDLNAVRVAKADLLEKVRQQGFADEADMKRNAFYLDEERKLLDGNLKTWQQKLAEHNQRMSDERYRKSRGMGDAIYESVVLPVSGTAQRMALNTVGSTARMLEAVGQLPAAVTGDEPYRSVLGELADMASSSVEQAETMESTKTKGALFNEDWEVNKDAFLPQLMRTATYMAGMMGGGLAAGKSGVVAASMLTTEEDYYRDAKEKGLSDQQAQAFAIAGAGMTSALELISPQLYGQGTAKKMLAEKAIQFIKGGATQKQALADAAKFVAEEVGKENVQELSQMLGDKVVEGAANMALGEDRFDTAVSMQEVAETVVMTSILSGLAAGGARAIDRPIRLQSMEWAARNPDAVRKYINEAVPEQQRDNLLERLDVLEKAYNGLPTSIQQDEDLERKAEILDAVAEKQEIKAQQKKAVVDETVAALEGDKYEEALSRADSRIAAALGATMEKVRAAQERKKMAEKEGKAPQAAKAIPDTPAQTMEWEGAAVQPRQEEQTQPQDGVQQEQVTAPAEQAVPQQDERPADAEPQATAAPAAEEGVAPIADIAPEAIAEIDDVLGVAPVAPATQPEGPVRPEGTGAVPVSESRAKSQPGGKRPMLYVKNVQKALSENAPGLKVIIHNNPAAYRASIEGYNAKHGTKADPSQSTAIYLPASEEVHLSPSADGQSLAHEAAHPIVSALIAHKPEVFERLYDELAADPAMAEMLKFGKLYEDQDMVVQKAESIVRLMDAVASGEIKVSTDPKSAWQRFKRWLQDLLASIGFDTRSIDLSDPKNVREFAASFSDAIANGIKIKKVQGDGARSSAPDLQKDADRLVDGWYSRLNDAVVAKGSTMPASQWKTWMEARAKEGMMSMEEAKWTGLSDWLAGKGNEKVTPQQVREFLKENRVRVEVKELGGSKPPLEWRRYDLGAAGFYAEANGFKITPGGMGKVDLQGPNSYIGRYDGEEEAREAAEEVHQGSKEYGVTPKFSQYQLPGGTNYREVLVTLPGDTDGYQIIGPDGKVVWRDNSTKPDAELLEKLRATYPEGMGYRVRSGGDKSFKSTHYDEPNILVHLRLNDRTGPNGEKILFIEELQSDWGQAGKKKGFRVENISKEDEEEITSLRKAAEERAVKYQSAAKAVESERVSVRSSVRKKRGYENVLDFARLPASDQKRAIIEEMDAAVSASERIKELEAEAQKLRDEASDAQDRLIAAQEKARAIEETPPLAPFVEASDAWVELGLKQAVRMAVEGGYDRIAWTTGEQQYDRWGSQVFSWTKRGDNWYVLGQEQAGGDAFAGMEEQLSEQAFSEGRQIGSREDLRELVLATMGREKKDWSPENWKKHIDKITDGIWQQMKDGKDGSTMPRREGMKGFYDKILPTVAKKVSKRLGGDGVVGEVGLATSDIANKWSVRLANGSLYEGALTHRSAMDALNNGPKNHPHLDFDGAVIVKEPNTTDQQSISITPDMRAKAMSGVPLMQRRDQAFNGPEQPKTPIGDTKTVMVDGKERTVFNSNGKPIHPTVEGVRNFWRWFSPSPRQLLDGLSVSEVSGLKRDTKALADFIESQSSLPEPDRFGIIPASVFTHVAGVVNNPKILDAIVRSLPVDVVDFLGRKKVSPKEVLNNPSVLKDVLAIDPASDVSLRVNPSGIAEATIRIVANAGAEITGLAGGSFKRNAAVLADASDPVLGAHVRKHTQKNLGIIAGFGDSKVVDAEGKPLVVYHGTAAEFTEFKASNIGTMGPGIYFAFSRDAAQEWASRYRGGRVIEAYLRVENPVEIANTGEGSQLYDRFAPNGSDKEMVLGLRQEGYDAAWATGGAESAFGTLQPEIAVYDPTQIKSATGNHGTFDPSKPSILEQRRDPAEVAAVFAKHGMTADAASAYMQQKGIDPGFAQQVVDAMQQPAAGEANAGSLKSSIAPFYRLKIKDVADAKRVATTPAYKNFEATLIALADAMGIRIVRIVPGIGKWAGVIELSAKVEFATGQNFDRLREYTAIMGALAPESQDATIVGEYLRRGDPRVNGHAIRIPVNDLDKAISIAESSPVGGADIDTETREVIIFANNEADVRQAQLVAEELRRQGVGTGEVISEPLRSEFISESRRADILNDVSSRLQGESGRQQGGSRLRDLVQLAQERDAAFQRLRGYNPSLASFADLRNRQIKLLESGEDLSDIDRRRLDVNRRRIAPAVRQQFSSWQGLYSEAKAEISEVGDRIAALFGGYNIPFSIKGVERATEKTLDWYLGSPTLLGDGARTTIIVDDISKSDKVFDRIKKEYYSTREENYVTDLGYPKRLLEVLTANGRLAEFQVMTPGAYLAKDGVRMFPEDKKKDAASLLAEVRDLTGAQIPDGVGHLFYEIQRDPRVSKRLREAAVPVSQMYYKAFMDPSSMKGFGPSLMEALGGFMAEFQAAKADEGKWTAKHWTNNRELIREIISGTAGIDGKKPERAKRKTTKRLVASRHELEKVVTDEMVYYERLPNDVTEAEALSVIEADGVHGAAAAVLDRSNPMPLPVRVVVGGVVLNRLREEKRYDEMIEFGEEYVAMMTELGQGVQALQRVYGKYWDADIAIRNAQKAVAKGREKRKRATKKTIDRLKKGLEQENAEAAEEAVKAAKVRVKAAKAASSAEPKAEPTSYGAKNKVFTRERYASALKSLRGKLLSGVPPELVDIIGYHIEAGTRSFADIAVKLTRSLGRKVLPYMKEAYTEAAKQANEQGIEFERTTDAEIDEYIFKANTDKAVEKLRKAIERKNKKESDAAIAELQQVSKDYGLWGQYREYAIDRLKRMQLQEIKQDIEADPPLREFTDSLVRNLSAQAREAAEEAGLEKPEPKKRRDDIEVIADAYKNFERYKEVWEATRREMQAPYFAAMARAEKAETPEARAEAQDAIQRERAKLERLDNYFGEVGPKPFAESIMAKAVKDGMKALDQKIEEIIKKHYTEYDSAKRSLQTKLVELAGLDGKEAEELASAVGAEFDRIATEKKRRFIRSVLPATDKVARKRKVKAVEDELVALTNAGAFSDDDFIEAYGEKMGWPRLTHENIQEIERLAERVQTSPEGRPRVEAIQDLLGYQQSIPGIDAMEIAQSVWYANMLSGFETQEVNVLANFANMLLEASIATGRMASSKEQRKYLAGLWTSMAEGMSTGKLEASAVWGTGYDPIRGQIQVPSTLERHTFKGGAKNPANYLKYVRRFMVASDAIFFEGNRSLRAYQLAVRMSSADKKLDPSIDVRNRAAELLGQGNAELEQAKMQAQREYDDEVSAINGSSLGAREKQKALKKAELDRKRRVFELTEKKRPEPIAVGAAQFARRATYNYKPEGTLGAIANFINLGLQSLPAFRYVVPFTNVIANVANETLNYTPVGYIRAARDGRVFMRRDEFTPDQKADAIWKASIGMATMAALYLLSHPTDDDDDPVIEITANGFGDYRKNEVLREKGWRPYSFRIGKGPYISYQYTPLILAMGFIGNLNDYARYRKKKVTDTTLDKWTKSLGYTSLAFMDMTFLSSMNNVLSAAMDPRNEDRVDDLTRGMAKTARSFVVPNLYTQGAKMVMNLAEIPQKETRGTIAGNLLRDIPVFRAQYQDAVNVLGEPVMPEWGRLASMPQDDPVANFLGDKGISIVAPHPNTLTYTDDNGDERMYTDEQKHEFYVRRGQYIRSKIESSMDQLRGMEKKRLEKRIARITADATKRAKMGLLGIQ